MCDDSLHLVDVLVSTKFPESSRRGFASVQDPNVAVCLRPGTELAFEKDVQSDSRWTFRKMRQHGHRVARFRQIHMDEPNMHHDALEFPDGEIVLLTALCEGQHATVVQLPAESADRDRQSAEALSSRRVTRGLPATNSGEVTVLRLDDPLRSKAGAPRRGGSRFAMSETELRAPRISRLAWGHIEVDDRPFRYAKVFPGGAREWDWRETGPRHVPGAQPADVQEPIDQGAKTVILSARGVWRRLKVRPETLDLLAKNGIAVEVLQTEDAVKRFNELREDVPASGLFHSTC
jgi:hypothetical protein